MGSRRDGRLRRARFEITGELAACSGHEPGIYRLRRDPVVVVALVAKRAVHARQRIGLVTARGASARRPAFRHGALADMPFLLRGKPAATRLERAEHGRQRDGDRHPQEQRLKGTELGLHHRLHRVS